MKKIVILGHRSFVATGLYEKLIAEGHEVDCISRGEETRNQDIVGGNLNSIATNKFLKPEYDIVINFVI